MTTLSQLKKSSGSIERLNKELEKIKNGNKFQKEEDTRFWKPELDAAGNGYAVIRFLPTSPADGEDAMPWVRVWNHGFHGPKGRKGPWYIENSLTTLGQDDPVSEYNSKLWATGKQQYKDYVSKNTKRRLQYYVNILVVNDPKNPKNNGKVFLYKFGKKIFDKITEAMNPPFDDEGRTPEMAGYNPTNAVNPFDLWKGANFKLKVRKVEGYPNYDTSAFDAPSAVADNDDDIEKIWKAEHALKEFTDPKNFKSYDALLAQLNKVLEIDTKAWTGDGVASAPTQPTLSTKYDAPEEPESAEEVVLPDDDEGDEFLKRFEKLKNG